MAKARSPDYPAIGLKEAIEKVRMVWGKDYQNRVPRAVIAEHMGYKGLNGGSLPILAALNKYGLLEGRGDETRVSDRALAIIAHSAGHPERVAALNEAASAPDLFAELDQKFSTGKASDSALRSYLLTQKFIPTAADAAIRSYRETKQVVDNERFDYNPPSDSDGMEEEAPMNPTQQEMPRSASAPQTDTPPAGARRAVFPLSEGDVMLTFPSDLSADGYDELGDYLEIFLKRAKRESAKSEKEAGSEKSKPSVFD